MRATRAIIHLATFRSNIGAIQRHVGSDVGLCLAVKADAYGHGAVRLSKIAVEEGVRVLAVATVDEAAELRDAGIDGRILCLGLPIEENLSALVAMDGECIAADEYSITSISKAAAAAGRLARVHLKVDTGMGRIGCPPEMALNLAKRIDTSRDMNLVGVCTHFPTADQPDDPFTVAQIEIFSSLIDQMKQAGIDPGDIHMANSGGILGYPSSWKDMVRPGILAYGYYPSKDQERCVQVSPVMQLETHISQMKTVPAGTGISYGLHYKTSSETTIATIPVGYGDGYSRMLSGKSSVLILGTRYPVAGTICMDQCMVDLGHKTGIGIGEKVIVFGSEPGAPNAADIADAMGTIPYEITCGISKRVPRIFLD